MVRPRAECGFRDFWDSLAFVAASCAVAVVGGNLRYPASYPVGATGRARFAAVPLYYSTAVPQYYRQLLSGDAETLLHETTSNDTQQPPRESVWSGNGLPHKCGLCR